MQWLAAVLAPLTIAFVATGCGGSSSGNSSSGSSSGTTTHAAGTPHRGGTLVFARSYDPITFNPLQGEGDNGSLWDMVQIYDQLVEYRPGTLDVQPGLASSWSVSPDGLTYTFHLRNARWSDGSPVTSADAKFSIDRFGSPKIDAAFQSFLASSYGSSQTPDAHTLVVKLKRPDAGFISALAVPVASITPKAIFEREGATAFGAHPVGSGPFKLAQWVRGSFVKLVRNPYYWKPGLPYLDGVTINYVPNDNTRVLQAQSGQADLAEAIPYTQVATLAGQNGVTVQNAPINAYDAIWLNHSYAPLSDPKVRQALNYALNKVAIDKAVYAGKATVANSTIAQTKYWSSSVPAYPYDLAKAKQLMAASKYAKGFSLTLKVPAGDTVHNSVAVIAKSEWAPLGVNVSIQPQETAGLFTAYSAGNYQASIPLPSITSDVLVPDELALAWLVFSPSYQSFFTQYKDPTVASMVVQANRSTSDAQRAQLWPRIQQLSMNDAPWIPIVFPPALTAVSNRVQNFQTLRSGWWDLGETWLKP